ncbi:MAG: hypothetical protein A2V92_04160 [Candidatus Muproteobacteria bacterium RBG_16_65_31]|uniref:Cytochrome c domain-containing protein n=1 Tax=Candidatus Muproteobacteria bacterium RBG_16_65_31 TaxID=1817759 RepID=A0A1F6TFY6_9PROT|nr:MAG: hypothetical protein A2V92_04160 [Candidatus Muproteobacteria bacterium RBG_16_65_31]
MAFLAAALLVLLALAFARVQNPAPRAPGAGAAAVPADMRRVLVEAGRAVYQAQGCARCHSIAGSGNPRYPLDGVGARREAADIRRWIMGAGEAEGRLPAGVRRAKQAYRKLPRRDLDALIAFLETLRN